MHKLYSFKGGGIKPMLVGNKNETKKANESLLLDCFLDTKIGRKWCTKNKITDKIDSEEPDFIFTDLNRLSHGLELVKFVRQGGDYQEINRTMQHMVEQVYAYFLKQNLNIGLVVTPINKEHLRTICLRYRYSGITKLEEKPEEIKNKIIKAIEDELPNNKNFISTNIDIVTHWLRIRASINSGIEATPTFNCERMYFDLQPDKLRNIIDKKNALVEKYLHKCNLCSLLIVVDNEDNCFSPVTISKSVLHTKYASNFDNIFLLYIDGGYSKSYKLRIVKNL